MKKIVSIMLALSFVFASVFSTNAAKSVKSGVVVTPSSLSIKDINRLADIMTNIRGKQVRVVNATRFEHSSTTWIVRVYVESDGSVEDFALTTYPFKTDPSTSQVKSLPFSTVEEGNAIFGPCWYYFGIYDEIDYSICGYVVAERIKRWGTWEDMLFTGETYRGVRYNGAYSEPNDMDFVAKHIE